MMVIAMIGYGVIPNFWRFPFVRDANNTVRSAENSVSLVSFKANTSPNNTDNNNFLAQTFEFKLPENI
jgi:hypothetical protein